MIDEVKQDAISQAQLDEMAQDETSQKEAKWALESKKSDGALLGEELLALDADLRQQGSSLRSVIEHIAKNAFGINITLPHRDTKSYLERLNRDGPEPRQRPRKL